MALVRGWSKVSLRMTDRSSTSERVQPWRRRWLLIAAVPMLWGLAATWRVDDPEALAAAVAPVSDAPAAPASHASAAPVEVVSAPQPTATGSAAAPPATSSAAPTPPECEPTPLTPQAMASALREGHILHFGFAPHADRWACAWAHCAFEQSLGNATYANNLGHVTARHGTGRVCRRRLRERVTRDPDRWELLDIWFHVFDSPEDGARAYWRLLAASYNSVLAHCDNGDARGAAGRLAAIGYFTGPEQPYVDGMARLFVNARGAIIPRLLAAQGLD